MHLFNTEVTVQKESGWSIKPRTEAYRYFFVKGIFSDVKGKINFFEFTFKLKIKIDKNRLVNFTV